MFYDKISQIRLSLSGSRERSGAMGQRSVSKLQGRRLAAWVKTAMIGFFFVAGIGLSGATAAVSDSSNMPTVKLVYWRSIDDLPLYVGVEKGFFREAGVNVELVFIKGEHNTLAAALRGDVDGGYISLASLIKLTEKKTPIKVAMWMGHAHEGTKCGIHVGAQTRYQTLQDMKGMRLALSGSIMTKTLIHHALSLGGNTLRDIRPMWGGRPDNPMQHESALRSGGIDGFIV